YVCQFKVLTKKDAPMKFIWNGDPEAIFTKRFRPFEVVVLLDNLFHNSSKADAKTIEISTQIREDESLEIVIADDGKGVPDSNAKKIFQPGFTTTNGSGYGLFHCLDIARELDASLTLGTSKTKGAEFRLEISP
ncbi:MAG: ATP-binding protein, partial [Verrucomicrobiota bacterium]